MKIGKKAFTLIELMIVVVILGVLMSTVLPKLTGAQARARDAGRVADLGNIAAALQVYYDDNGQFPSTGSCLSSGNGTAASIKNYMQSQKVPQDPQPTANNDLCNAPDGNDAGKGRYFYSPVTKDGLARNAYVLCADMETLQKANTQASNVYSAKADGTSIAVGKTAYATLQPLVGAKVGTNKITESDETTNGAGDSVYCILRP